MATMTLLVGDPSNNQLGRAQSVYRTALAAGLDPRVVTTVQHDRVWEPLVDSDLARSLTRVDRHGLRAFLQADDAPVVVVKPRWDSLGSLLAAGRAGLSNPVVIDVDDPDLEELVDSVRRHALSSPHRAAVRWWRYRRMRSAVLEHASTVSNPVLQRTYGGVLLPHARPDRGPGLPHTTREPQIAFIGSPKAHKGVDVLRAAVARLAPRGFTLVVTAPAPVGRPVPPWETWTGPLDEAASMELLRTSDVVALPSLDRGWGRAQLPMKLVDGMLAGRAVVASRIEPMSWALAGAGLLTTPGSLSELTDSLVVLSDPQVRQQLGDQARRRALDTLTPDVLAPRLLEAIEVATARTR